MSGGLAFEHIGYTGHQAGVASFTEAGVSWTDRSNTINEKLEKANILRITWTVFGPKAHIVVYLTDGSFYRLDGFEPDRYDEISQYLSGKVGLTLEKASYATGGSQFGEFSFGDKSMSMVNGSKQQFEMRLDNVTQCVIGNNRNEVEIQFKESESADADGDLLCQMRVYFPPYEEEDEQEESRAEEFQRCVMERGSLDSVTGDVLVEFSKDQGNFVTPRGKYAIQMYSTFLRMHGEKYDYKIQYEDVDRLFLLHRPDGYTSSVVISLNKPIRQGNQRYGNLVIQTTREEETIEVNLSEEEIKSKYDGQLAPEVKMPMSSLIAKVFKVLSQSRVYVPKNFRSDRDAQAVKCSLKANEGLLFPLEKSLIFIHKPTLIIQFSDIEAIEFLRYAPGVSATRNFDISITVQAQAASVINAGSGVTGSGREYVFSSIDRSEYNNLYDFMESKKLPLKTPKQDKVVHSFADDSSDNGGQGGIGDMDSLDSEEEDDDYEAGKSSDSGSGSGSGSDDSGSDGDDGDQKPSSREPSSKKRKREEVQSTPVKKKGKGKKDKNAPKRAKSAYNYFVESVSIEFSVMLNFTLNIIFLINITDNGRLESIKS